MVRHGETSWNAEGRIQGQTDIPMHDGGREAAWRTGVRLADIRFDAVYASDLSRTRETAELILAAQTAAPRSRRLRSTSFARLPGYDAHRSMKMAFTTPPRCEKQVPKIPFRTSIFLGGSSGGHPPLLKTQENTSSQRSALAN